ncbi:hypothetical protein OG271_01295 [Micromonospora rifamycinica]|uniref:hypothetical protein n=1 Tax=Micromonospora rifamycinica TaxID=291594 RepID=UPI002E2E5A30|nr:hypothetical protein [Micromonospora rifamycinica]
METSTEVPVASAIWAVEQVAAELRETYLGVAAAMVLLERVGAGCPHPALRLARRSAGDALDLAGEVDQQVTDGVRRLRVAAGHIEPNTIGGLVEVLDSVGSQWSAAADRIRLLPARVTAAGRQLRDAVPADAPPADPGDSTEVTAGQKHNPDVTAGQKHNPDVTAGQKHSPEAATRQRQHDTRPTARQAHDTETAARQWQHAAEQLDLMAECLTSAVAALGSYTDGLSGAEPATR